jgi:DNA mismatch endonuclease, patch repair protein
MARSKQLTRADGRPRRAVRRPRPETTDGSFAVPPGVRSRMQMQRTRDTRPEMAVRRALHAMGLRYRVDRAPLAGVRRRADIVFGPARVAVFIDGCFWHGCPEHSRSAPASNRWYWTDKIAGNQARDSDTDRRLIDAGWTVVRAWEHEPVGNVALKIAAIVRRRQHMRGDVPASREITSSRAGC